VRTFVGQRKAYSLARATELFDLYFSVDKKKVVLSKSVSSSLNQSKFTARIVRIDGRYHANSDEFGKYMGYNVLDTGFYALLVPSSVFNQHKLG
jgi:hypothetical protein